MKPHVNIIINVLLKNKDTDLHISYESATNTSSLIITNKPVILKNGIESFDFTKEEVDKLMLLKKYNSVNPMYLLHSKKTVIDKRKQMEQYIDRLVHNYTGYNTSYEETTYSTTITNRNSCILDNLKFLAGLLKKYKKYLAVIYELSITASYDDTYITIDCATNQTITNENNIDIEVSESTISNIDGFEKFFNDVSPVNLESQIDKEMKVPIFSNLFSEFDYNLIMDTAKDKTIDFYKLGNKTKPKVMYNVSLNNETRKLKNKLFDEHMISLFKGKNELSNNDKVILDLRDDFQTTDIEDIDCKYYDIIECYTIEDNDENIKHISKTTMLDLLNTIINNIEVIQYHGRYNKCQIEF